MKFLIPLFKCFVATSENIITSSDGRDGDGFRVFTFNELKVATKGYSPSNKIGEGDSGSVYQGRLIKDGSIVAVKVLSVELESLRGEREFISAFAALSDIKHENLVGFRGCCVVGNKRLLVCEYMEKTALYTHPGTSRLNEDETGFSQEDIHSSSDHRLSLHSYPPPPLPSSSASGKRPVVETRPLLFSKRQKSISYKRPRSEILDLTEDPPASSPQEVEVPRKDSGLHPSTSEPPTETPVDSAPQVTTGYSTNFLELPYTVLDGFKINEESTLWKKQDAFHTSRPLLLERIRRDYDAIRDPLEIHGVVARHLMKALNASSALPCRADRLNDARAGAYEKERALRFQVRELQEENERLKANVALATSKKRKAQDQALAKIEKHDLLHAWLTRLEGENFSLQNKLTRVQLLHNQANRRASEGDQWSKAVEEALPGRIERAIDEYQRSEEFRMEADEEEDIGPHEPADTNAPTLS
ncbi:hypothetical protein LIER_31939 [Lithospermum erythrorhizon]|uniref:Protein kinase domain-containing protein n=1 Tax=Lithospermum erythrorhizon TaxID=34254 RepID=A0AAV3RXT9_LITER